MCSSQPFEALWFWPHSDCRIALQDRKCFHYVSWDQWFSQMFCVNKLNWMLSLSSYSIALIQAPEESLLPSNFDGSHRKWRWEFSVYFLTIQKLEGIQWNFHVPKLKPHYIINCPTHWHIKLLRPKIWISSKKNWTKITEDRSTRGF